MLLHCLNADEAHSSGLIAEGFKGIPNNILSVIVTVAMVRFERLDVFSDDYEARDATGERDYIHVDDLAVAHLTAAKFVNGHNGCEACNVGKGQRFTELEMIRNFEKVSGMAVPYRVVGLRSDELKCTMFRVEQSARMLEWRAACSSDDISLDM